MVKISYCCIYKDEEKHLLRWIPSAKAIGDEIIAVDTGSSDGSNELLRKNGIEPLYFKWINDFAAAKNFALDKATGDWIIFLDADEFFPESQWQAVRRTIEKIDKDKNVQVIECNMYNIDEDDNDTILTKMFHWRIYRNMETLRYNGKIHEGLSWTGNLVHKREDLIIYHTGYSSGLTRKKGERNLEMLKKDIEENGGEPTVTQAHYMASTYTQLNDIETAKKYARIALKGSNEELDAAPIKMYRILFTAEERGANDFNKKMEILDEGINRFNSHPDLLFEKIKLLYQSRMLYECDKLSKVFFKRLNDKKFMLKYESMIYSCLDTAYFLFADVASRKYDFENAKRYIVEALKLNKHNDEYITDFAKYFETERISAVQSAVSGIYGKPTGSEKETLKKAFADCAYGDVYLKLLEPEYGAYEYFMCRGKWDKAADAVKERLLALFGEARYYYKTHKDRKVLHTSVPMEYLKNGEATKEEELDNKDFVSLLNAIITENARLILALCSMSDKEFEKDTTKDLMVSPALDMLLAAFNKPHEQLRENVVRRIYDTIMKRAGHTARERITNAVCAVNDDGLKFSVATELMDKREILLAKQAVESVSNKNSGYYMAMGKIAYCRGKVKEALQMFKTAKQLGVYGDELSVWASWHNLCAESV